MRSEKIKQNEICQRCKHYYGKFYGDVGNQGFINYCPACDKPQISSSNVINIYHARDWLEANGYFLLNKKLNKVQFRFFEDARLTLKENYEIVPIKDFQKIYPLFMKKINEHWPTATHFARMVNFKGEQSSS